MTSHDDARYCAALPHDYWDIWVLWCPHVQAFIVTGKSYGEQGREDDPQSYEYERIELGPFDGVEELERQVARFLVRFRSDWQRLRG